MRHTLSCLPHSICASNTRQVRTAAESYAKKLKPNFEGGIDDMLQQMPDWLLELNFKNAQACMPGSPDKYKLNCCNPFGIPTPHKQPDLEQITASLGIDQVEHLKGAMMPLDFQKILQLISSPTMPEDILNFAGGAFGEMITPKWVNGKVVPAMDAFQALMEEGVGAGIEAAMSAVGSTLSGLFLSSNPVTGIFVAIRKVWKLTKKTYGLANQAYKMKVVRVKAAANAAKRQLMMGAIVARAELNSHSMIEFVRAAIAFPRQLKNDFSGIVTAFRRLTAGPTGKLLLELMPKSRLALESAQKKRSRKGGSGKGGKAKEDKRIDIPVKVNIASVLSKIMHQINLVPA